MRSLDRQESPHATGAGFCCPYCSAALVPRGAGLLCEPEGRFFAASDGVYRLLEEKRRTELRPLIELEHRLRRDQGFTAIPGLPEAPRSHRRPHFAKRSRNLREGLRMTGQVLGEGPWRVLEVGAGCAWAGAVLAAEGHRVTAVDASLDPATGCSRPSGCWPPAFGWSGRADMEALPLEAGSHDLVLAVDALHHARRSSARSSSSDA